MVEGWAPFTDAKTCTVRPPTATRRDHAEHVLLATGSEAVALPVLPFGGT